MFAQLRTWWHERTARYSLLLTLGWTAVVLLSLSWNFRAAHMKNIDRARIEAHTFYDLNLSFRHWAASHGGVYVPVTDAVRPNPYLMVEERDVTTTTGKNLTLMNPAWVTREVFEGMNSESSPAIVSRLTSLKYLNPVNKPDPWEEAALRKFEEGATEEATETILKNKPYLRIMRPFRIEEGCLRCHGSQGYKIGDIRGGISISIPLEPHLEAEAREQAAMAFTHLALWLIGSGGILLFSRNLRAHQEQLVQSEQKYRLLFNSNPHPMWVYDVATLRFLTVNTAAVRHYGFSEDEFLAMTTRDIDPAGDRTALPESVTVGNAGPAKAGVRLHRKKDGSLIHVESTSHEVDFGGRRAQLVLANDVTDRMRLEEQLRQAQKMEAVGLLAGGVAHDFNNILTAIIGYGNLIEMKLPKGNPLLGYAENIKVTAQRAAQLTQSLLAFSRKQVIHPAPVELNTIIGRFEKLLRRLIREDIMLRLELTDQDTTILADTAQIEQVLVNLATNARDAMPDGGVLTIRSETVDLDAGTLRGYVLPGSYVLLTVSDTGAGMNERTRERVFEPFFTTKETGKGTGLGLATVYGIVKQHQGFADVESSPDAGTCIRIYLPRMQEPVVPQAAPPVPEVRGGNETVLLAEDDNAIRALIRSVLAEFGYTVIEAADGEEAVRLYREQGDRVHLLLFDVIMPKKNGRAAFEEVRETRPDIKALFISGYSADTLNREVTLEKGLHFISKPLSPTELLQKVRDVLDS